jgi:dTDP-4-dehydrorhamnose reductase
MVVLVTGANGQLGQSIKFILDKYPEIDFVFCDSKSLDITILNKYLNNLNPIFA